MMKYDICKDNVLCCDDNCQRCANLIYNKYMEQKAEIKRLKNAYKQCAWERDILAEDYREEIRKDISILQVDINKVKSKARKEFWDRLKKEAITKYDWNDYIEMECGDNLLKAMETGDTKK